MPAPAVPRRHVEGIGGDQTNLSKRSLLGGTSEAAPFAPDEIN
jgi:hypothetical protein